MGKKVKLLTAQSSSCAAIVRSIQLDLTSNTTPLVLVWSLIHTLKKRIFHFIHFLAKKRKAVLINSLVIHIVLLSKMMLDDTKPSLTV